MKKHSFSQRLTQFLNGKGFYIALAFCVLAIAASCWYLWYEFAAARRIAAETASAQTVTVEPGETEENTAASGETDPADSESLQAEEEAPADASSEETLAQAEPTAEPETATTAAPAEIEADDEASEAALAENTAWVWPLEGDVVAAFSSDTLSYNEALGDWRTHDGMDLSAQLGQSVAAACAGEILSVEEDPLLGWTVTLDCGNDITVQYSNLAEEIPVSAGERVDAGDMIGTVGSSAAGESHDTPWLHVAVLQAGEAVEPSEFFS